MEQAVSKRLELAVVHRQGKCKNYVLTAYCAIGAGTECFTDQVNTRVKSFTT